jgi:DHA1 family bicyclomycin/chloramphenicol resistance-like MFS transporter
MMLAGRLMQGLGISAPRTVTTAIVRDQYKGRGMARVMSFIMTVLILVPMLAPTLGQAIIMISNWQGIFISFLLIALISLIWFAFRIPETLTDEKKAPFSLKRIFDTTLEIMQNRTVIGYTLSAGLISGAFLGYLNSAQQIYQELYALEELFPLYFALGAFSLGLASFLNARFVMRFGMRFLVRRALILVLGLSIGNIATTLSYSGILPLWILMGFIMMTFFGIGILFGNLNALAMEPLGHQAGIGAAIVGSLSTLISIPIGTIIGQSYNHTTYPLFIGIAILSGSAALISLWVESKAAVNKAIND